LAAGGQAGVELTLRLLQDELVRGMALLGCRTLEELGRDRVQQVSYLESKDKQREFIQIG